MYITGYLNGLTGQPSGEKGQVGAGPQSSLRWFNYDIQDNRLTRVDEGTASNDATNKHQLETNIQQVSTFMVDGSSHMTGDLDLNGNQLIGYTPPDSDFSTTFGKSRGRTVLLGYLNLNDRDIYGFNPHLFLFWISRK